MAFRRLRFTSSVTGITNTTISYKRVTENEDTFKMAVWIVISAST